MYKRQLVPSIPLMVSKVKEAATRFVKHLSRKHQFGTATVSIGTLCPVSKLLHANSQPLTPQSFTKLAPSIPRIVGKAERRCHSVLQHLSRKHQFRTATVSIGTTLSCFETPPCEFSTTDAPILHQTGSVDLPDSR